MPAAKPQQTPLYDLHRKLGARMVEFANWQMPLQYQGIMAEHLHCRSQAGLFDVSHMGQLRLTGEGALAALEAVSPSDLQGLAPMRQCYSLLLNNTGGIEDDCMIGRADGFVWVVINAARTPQGIALIKRNLPQQVHLEHWQPRALLALQGPAAAAVMRPLSEQAAALPFMGLASVQLAGAPCLVARSGYTGEDGFEISCPAADAPMLAERLLAAPEVEPIGLGARDSLRLEAGLCLYGQDLDATTTPAQARLGWVVAKNRRDPSAAGFAGADKVLAEMRHGPQRLRVGLDPEGSRPVRAGALLYDPESGEQIGAVTSGGFAPSLQKPCAMGYVSAAFAKRGQRLQADVRGHQVVLTVCPAARLKNR